MTMFELFGWVGAILVLVAYYLVSTEKTTSRSLSFQALNIGGAIFLVLYTYNCKAYASMSVNLIWIFIGLASISNVKKVTQNVQNQTSNNSSI